MRKSTVLVICLSVAVTAAMLARYVLKELQADQRAAVDELQRTRDEWRESLARWIAEDESVRAMQAMEPEFDRGFHMGFLGGQLARDTVDFPMSPELIESLASHEAEEREIPTESHLSFLQGFKAGWDVGWGGK